MKKSTTPMGKTIGGTNTDLGDLAVDLGDLPKVHLGDLHKVGKASQSLPIFANLC